MAKRIYIRADAAHQIGVGHVMRTLTLALELKRLNCEVTFICRALPEYLAAKIERAGCELVRLSNSTDDNNDSDIEALDAAEVLSWLKNDDRSYPDWVIVDHYDLSEEWEAQFTQRGIRIMVIDDLPSRRHACEILLDQTLNCTFDDYHDLVPMTCRLALGPKYALLRPEFRKTRQESIALREPRGFSKLLISLGGTDPDNVTSAVLESLLKLKSGVKFEIDVILGASSAHKHHVGALVDDFAGKAKLYVGVENMALHMLQSDVAIGAAGSTSWERCCLGLPSLTLVLADNQLRIDKALQDWGASISLGDHKAQAFDQTLANALDVVSCYDIRSVMAAKASQVTDGLGANRVASLILGEEIEGTHINQ